MVSWLCVPGDNAVRDLRSGWMLWSEECEKLGRLCKLSEARLSILMVVFCYNPHAPTKTPCSHGKQLGKFLTPIGLKLINLHKLPSQRVSFPKARIRSLISDRFYSGITKPIKKCCLSYSFANSLRDFSVHKKKTQMLNDWKNVLCIWHTLYVAAKSAFRLSLFAPLSLKTFYLLWHFIGILLEWQNHYTYHLLNITRICSLFPYITEIILVFQIDKCSQMQLLYIRWL